MNKLIFFSMMTAVLFSACRLAPKEDVSETIIGKKPLEVKDGRLNAEVLHLMGQVGGVTVSPDGKTVLYSVSYADIALNKRNTELFSMRVDGSDKKQITHTPGSESNAQYIKEGTRIAFLYQGQLWEMNPDGTARAQISRSDKAIEGFRFSPDGKKVLFVSQVKAFESSAERYEDLDKSSGRIIDDLMYKHWDEWVESIPHPFVADFDGFELSNVTDLLEGEPFESPMKPMGGIEQLAWSPDSKSIAYTCRKKTGKAYAQSTNSDIYLYNTGSKRTGNLTEGMLGYDINPQFSSDGRYIAWLSMKRDGYESDKVRLFVLDLTTTVKKYITEYFDYNVDDFCWDKQGSDLFFVSNVLGTNQLYRVNALDAVARTENHIVRLTEGDHDYTSVAVADGCLIGLRRSLSSPPEVYAVSLADGAQTNLSQENTDILNQMTMGRVEARWIKTTTREDMLTWVVYPPDFDPEKQYPAILYCQGGPQSTVSQFWSTRWNLQMMAAHGYIVVAPNRHGVPGFGQAWNEQISGDYGGQNMRDYLSAIDALSKEPFVDENRLGCTGASYGGFSVYWLAGNHNKRFKAFFSHAGIMNLEAQYLETEEMWFVDWDLGGPYWERYNSTAQKSYANSPHLFVGKWDTPIMVSHGELDYRILASQGMMAFNAAQLRNIPSRMLIFPDENHWISQPQNGILFQREFFRWFDHWLKKENKIED
ncbi:MAG: S9 family peptidase [Dysgonamonadaceae bacterium]|jgi:dipeptidyl aminopeptidase/acylaminoacyl peptidase|nr:S9 family peptidase [Dysgonamonadaceae bacterium]